VTSADVQIDRPLGRPISGPTALGSDPRRLWHLAWSLAVTDFKLRFFGSVLGYLWQLMRPLMLFGVLYVVFTTVFDLGNEVKYYPVALLLGIVLYSFLNEATSASVRSLVMRENLVRKIEFPRLAVPLATTLTALFNLGLNLVPVFVFLVAAGGAVRWSWLEFPLLVAFLTVLATGLAMLLSALFVRYRDVEPIWDVVLQIAFYATPIIYPIQTVISKGSPGLAKAMMCNPFAAVVQQGRHAVVDPSHLSTASVLGSKALLLIPLGITIAVFAIGFSVFSRMAPHIAEDL
jgi:ABC-2 type transport system permease protein